MRFEIPENKIVIRPDKYEEIPIPGLDMKREMIVGTHRPLFNLLPGETQNKKFTFAFDKRVEKGTDSKLIVLDTYDREIKKEFKI